MSLILLLLLKVTTMMMMLMVTDGGDANDDAADADDDDDNANDRRDCDDTVCEAFTRITTRRLKHRYFDVHDHGGSRKQLGLRIGGCQLGV